MAHVVVLLCPKSITHVSP